MPVNVSSSLMHNHVPGRRFASQVALAVLTAADRSPVVFALDYKGRLTVTQRTNDETSGWAQTDLTALLGGAGGLGAAPYVQCFAASQDADGSIWLVLAAANDPTLPSTVLLSRAVPNTVKPADWSGFGTWLKKRDIRPGAVVKQLNLGSGDDGAGAPAIVADAVVGNTLENYMINSNVNDPTWTWLVVPLPKDAKQFKAAVSGHMPGLGRGVYTLYVSHPEIQQGDGLVFTTLPVMRHGKPETTMQPLKLPDAYGSKSTIALAALPTATGETELYMSGAGLHRYPLSMQQPDNYGPPIQILDKTLIHTTPQLAVSSDPDMTRIDVWTINGFQQLVHTTGTAVDPTASPLQYDWQAALVMEDEVTALAGYRVPTADGGTEAALATAGADFIALNTKQDESELWQTQNVALPAPNTAFELYTYTTRIEVTDGAGVALPERQVSIRPTSDVPAMINGKYYALTSGAAKAARTDGTGTVTIVVETTDLVAPQYQVIVEGEEEQNTDPAGDVKTLLRSVKTGQDIADAQRSDGGALFPNMNPELMRKCGYSAEGVQGLMKVYDDAVAAGPSPDGVPASEPFTALYCRYNAEEGGYELLRGDEALAALPDRTAWGWIKSVGDLLWSGIKAAANQIVEWAVHAANGVYEFVITIGGRVLAFVFKVAAQAISAIDFVLKATLGLTLKDIIAWLGFLFNWSDIRETHRFLAHLIDLGLDHAADQAGQYAKDLNQLFDQARGALVGNRIPEPEPTPVSDEGVHNAPPAEAAYSSPQANWANRQFQDNAQATNAAPVPVTNPGKFTSLSRAQLTILQHVVNEYKHGIVADIKQMDYGRFVNNLLPLIGDAVLGTVQEVTAFVMNEVVAIMRSFKKLVTARWDIPVLTWIYEHVICQGDGSQLTLLDVVALLAAIPVTVAVKAASGTKLFPTSVVNAALNAKTWNQLMAVLSTPSADDADAVGNLGHAARCSIAGDALRLVANLAFGIGAVLPVRRGITDRVKAAADMGAFACSLANVGLVAAERGVVGIRSQLDFGLAIAEIVPRAREMHAYLVPVFFGPIDDEDAEGFTMFECVYGLCVLIAVAISLGLEWHEDPPAGTSRELWRLMAALKFGMRAPAAIDAFLAFEELEPPSPFKTGLLITRVSEQSIASVTGMTLGVFQVINRQSDFNA